MFSPLYRSTKLRSAMSIPGRTRNALLCLSVPLAIVLTVVGGVAARAATGPIAILGVASETRTLLPHLTHRKNVVVLHVPYVTGVLNGVPVVVARSGVGKVNAAMTATILIGHFHPACIIFSGSAGALNPNLQPGDVVIGAKTAEHDFGTLYSTGMSHEPTDGIAERKQNPMYFPANPRLLKAAELAASRMHEEPIDVGSGPHTPRVVVGTIVTGDVFVADQNTNDALRKYFHADAVEMEGAAVAQVCWEQNVPFLAIRSISDNANRQTPTMFDKFYKLAARNSARLVMAIVQIYSTKPASY